MLQPHVLRHFAELARTGSLRVTADLQEIAPSALSRQINQLEKFLDTKLFIRSTKGMQLTEVGRELYMFIEENNRSIDALLQRIEDIDQVHNESINIAAVEGVSISFLPAVMARFSTEYPGTRLNVIVCGTRDVINRVSNGDNEIGIAFNCPSRDDLVLRARIPQPLYLVGRANHPALRRESIGFADITRLRLVLPTRRFNVRRIIEESLRTYQIDGNIAIESDSLLIIRQLITQTELITCMPKIVFEKEVETNTVSTCPIEDRLAQSATVDIVARHERILSPQARRFMEILLEAAKEKTVRHPRYLTL
jgi:DNA-binding transcriptional LysR family regulator